MLSSANLEDELRPLLRALAMEGLELTARYERRECSAEEYTAAFARVVERMVTIQNIPRNVGTMLALLEQMDEKDRASVLATETTLIPPER